MVVDVWFLFLGRSSVRFCERWLLGLVGSLNVLLGVPSSSPNPHD